MSAVTDSTVVRLTIVETIHYGVDITIGELNELCRDHRVPAYGEGEDVTAWLHDNAREAIEKHPGMLEQIEHDSGDVQGQVWEWEVTR